MSEKLRNFGGPRQLETTAKKKRSAGYFNVQIQIWRSM